MTYWDRVMKRGFIAASDPTQVHAEKSSSLWFRFGFCGERAEIRTAQPVGVFRPVPPASLCGACVCAIEDQYRRGASA